jgi:ribosome-associated translation inhibitor RaiA
MARTRSLTPASVEDVLRLGAGFSAGERDGIVRQLSRLNTRLRTFPAEGTDLLLSVKDRDHRTQHVVLECHLPHRPPLVARSDQSDLHAAIVDVRNELSHQLDETKTRFDRRSVARKNGKSGKNGRAPS